MPAYFLSTRYLIKIYNAETTKMIVMVDGWTSGRKLSFIQLIGNNLPFCVPPHKYLYCNIHPHPHYLSPLHTICIIIAIACSDNQGEKSQINTRYNARTYNVPGLASVFLCVLTRIYVTWPTLFSRHNIAVIMWLSEPPLHFVLILPAFFLPQR